MTAKTEKEIKLDSLFEYILFIIKPIDYTIGLYEIPQMAN